MTAITGLERGSELGQGLFSLSNLRAYMAFSGAPQDANRVLPWLADVLNPVGHQAKHPDYSFGDLISLFVVRELKRKGLKTSTIREAEFYLRKKWNTDRPFVTDELKTDGCGIYVDDELVAGGQLESADKHGQQVMREAVKERLSSVHYDDGLATAWNPAQHIVVDPRIQFGDPVVSGTRIATELVADMAAYASVDKIATDMGISEEQAEAALNFERHLAGALN
ncbi:MAG: hypothetical protein JWM24_2315 [Solirubrobacterales bacterium]|nr:hypothetical protein [Solirubrobacterales bacterium]